VQCLGPGKKPSCNPLRESLLVPMCTPSLHVWLWIGSQDPSFTTCSQYAAATWGLSLGKELSPQVQSGHKDSRDSSLWQCPCWVELGALKNARSFFLHAVACVRACVL
jgi:hypothetical protein